MSGEIDTQMDSEEVTDTARENAQVQRTEESSQATDNLASPVNRIISYIIDAVILYIVIVILGAIKLSLLGIIIGFGYFLTRDALPFLNGQSIGRKLMKIRAVTKDGQSLSGNFGPSVIRNAVFLIPFFGIVEAILLFTRESDTEKKGLRLGDEWANTKVVIEPN